MFILYYSFTVDIKIRVINHSRDNNPTFMNDPYHIVCLTVKSFAVMYVKFVIYYLYY